MTLSLTLIYVCKSPAKKWLKKRKKEIYKTLLLHTGYRLKIDHLGKATNKHHDMFMNQL